VDILDYWASARLVIYIDNVKTRSDITTQQTVQQNIDLRREVQCEKIVSPTPRDMQEYSRSSLKTDIIHPDRISQIRSASLDLEDEENCDLVLNQSSPGIEKAELFLRMLRKERKAFNKKKKNNQLSRTRSGNVIVKPLCPGQRSYLQCIPKDTIRDYLDNRK